MKLFLLPAALIFCAASAIAQTGHEGHNHGAAPVTAQGEKNEALHLKQWAYDFGKIPQGKPVYYTFEVVNNGKEPLKLDNVSATCGCTTPVWSAEPIAPGASSLIKVGYNAAAEGAFEKFITITYAGSNLKQLKITGTVWKAPEGSAPVNASVQFLKKQNL